MCGNVLLGRFDAEKPFFTTGGSFWTNSTTDLLASTTEADRLTLTRNRCNGEGYESVALVPLRSGKEIIGLLQLNDKRPNRFTSDMIAKVERVAAGIAVVLAERQAKEALRVGEEKYRTLFEESLDGIVLIGADRSILEANPAACSVLGMTEGEIRAAGRDGLLAPGHRRAPYLAELERTGKTAGEVTLVRKDGTRLLAEFTAVALQRTAGPPEFFVAFRDITERTRAEESLRESEERFRRVITQTKAGYFLIDREGRFVHVNDAWLGIHGYDSAEEVVGRHFSLTQVEEDLSASQRIVETMLAGGSVPDGEFSHRCRDGSVGYHTFTLSPVVAEGAIVALEGFLIDTTERRQAQEALRESQRDLLEAQELAHIGNYVYDPVTRQLTWSEGIYRIWGLDPKHAALKDSVRELMHPEDYERLESAVLTALKHGTSYELEFCICRPDGAARTLITTGKPQLDATGKAVLLKGTHQDITEYRRIEEDYRTLFREMLDGFALHEIICDKQGNPVDYRFLAVNPAFERMTGLMGEGIVGRTVMEVLPGTERHWIETYGKVALTGAPAFFENYHAQLEKHFQVTAFRPAPNQFACIFADVTERTRAEEALRESGAKISGILDNIRVGVSLISPKMEILELNPLMRERFPGVDLGRLPICYRTFNDPPREAVCDYCPTIKTLQDGLVHEATTQTPVAGAVRNYRVVSSPICDASGEVTAAIEMVEDVTESLALEAQLLQSQKMESVGRLAGGVAHDFNNMLGVILGHAEMALEHTGPAEPLYADLTEIRKAAERSADLTRQLLAFARKQTVAPRVLDLNEAVAGMLKMLERLIGEDIELDWQPGTDLWSVRVDPSQVGQVLTNLCVNARDAIAGVGRVAIATRNSTLDTAYCAARVGVVPGEYVELTVSDNGRGMEKETIGRLFEPFFTTKGVGEGTGLGLATVYGIVKQNKGFIEVESELGEGSTFTIYLPRHTAMDEPVEMESAPVPAARGQETILLVEDEPAILKLTTRMLESRGYTVVAASTPGEAIRLAREHPGEIHLLMTDVVMPEMNGRDLAKNLLALYPQMRRLFMSGYSTEVIAHQGVLEEGTHFIQKPFSSQDVSIQVRLALDREE
ncbi:MAG: hypothetical protein A2133_02935 [Actinobacteria bacterium RBG_16_64_13]|nr:MAG: hypothetical protein A2133_02935 [Actinobacteria bacterium RBG_16_64_13]